MSQFHELVQVARVADRAVAAPRPQWTPSASPSLTRKTSLARPRRGCRRRVSGVGLGEGGRHFPAGPPNMVSTPMPAKTRSPAAAPRATSSPPRPRASSPAWRPSACRSRPGRRRCPGPRRRRAYRRRVAQDVVAAWLPSALSLPSPASTPSFPSAAAAPSLPALARIRSPSGVPISWSSPSVPWMEAAKAVEAVAQRDRPPPQARCPALLDSHAESPWVSVCCFGAAGC